MKRRRKTALLLSVAGLTYSATALASRHDIRRKPPPAAKDEGQLSEPIVVLGSVGGRTTLPAVRGGMGFEVRVPFVSAGVGGQLSSFARGGPHFTARWVAGAGFGKHPDGQLGFAAEAYFGVPLHESRRSTEILLPLSPGSHGSYWLARRTAKATVPAHHLLLLELGALGGTLAAYRCSVPGCAPDAAAAWLRPWITTPAAGLRYTYFFEARSPSSARRISNLTDVYLHVLGPGVPVPDDLYHGWTGEPLEAGAIGAELGVLHQGWFGLVGVDAALGYLPVSKTALLRVALFVYGY